MYSEQEIDDVADIMLNLVRTETLWQATPSVIQSYSTGGHWEWHRESLDTMGWHTQNQSLTKTAGNVGQSSASFRGHVEFEYIGVFDPSGTRYYNKLTNDSTVRANGTFDCVFTLWAKNYAPGWQWIKRCGAFPPRMLVTPEP